jgi:hypothetical protein
MNRREPTGSRRLTRAADGQRIRHQGLDDLPIGLLRCLRILVERQQANVGGNRISDYEFHSRHLYQMPEGDITRAIFLDLKVGGFQIAEKA